VDLFKEYQEIFARDYKDIKGLVEEMGEMKIELVLGEKPIKKWTYKLSHKYKVVQKEIEGMLSARIIYLIDKDEWESPMVVQSKKHDPNKLIIFADFKGLNKLNLTDLFPTSFFDEIINEVAGHEHYSFTDRFYGYNQIPIAKEDQLKTTFVFKFGSFSYKVIPFGIKKSPTVFSRIVVKSFQEYIYKTMDVYFDDWTIYNIFKNHIQWLRLMLERCSQIQLSLNIKKCIFATRIGILLGHVVCKDGVKVDMEKIKIILDLNPHVNQKQFKIFLILGIHTKSKRKISGRKLYLLP
jgi:hypothetical protein